MKYIIVSLLVLSGCVTSQPARIYQPVEVCGNVQVPRYGILDRPASGGEILGGAVIGGVLGNKITDNNGGTAVGALLGGAIANQRKQEKVIVGYDTQYQCRTEYQ